MVVQGTDRRKAILGLLCTVQPLSKQGRGALGWSLEEAVEKGVAKWGISAGDSGCTCGLAHATVPVDGWDPCPAYEVEHEPISW